MRKEYTDEKRLREIKAVNEEAARIQSGLLLLVPAIASAPEWYKEMESEYRFYNNNVIDRPE